MKKTILIVVVAAVAVVVAAVGYRTWQRRNLEGNLAEGQANLRDTHYLEAAALFRKVLEKQPKNAEAITGLIESLLGAQNYHEVLQEYDATRSVPGLPTRLITYKGRAELSLADIEVNRREDWLAKAKATFDQAIRTDAKNAEAYVGRGLISLDDSRLDLSSPMTGFRPIGPFPEAEISETKKYLEDAVALKPDQPEALRGLAIIAFYEGNLQRVVDLLKQVKTGDEDTVILQALIQLSVQPDQAGKIREGLGGLGNVQSKSSRALLYCAIGLSDYLVGDFDSAQKNLKLAARNDEAFQFPSIRMHLAKVEEAQGNLPQAAGEMKELKARPGFTQDAVLLFLMALNAYQRGETNEMDLLLSEVKRVRPNAPDVLLFQASQETNELTRRDIYRDVLKVAPDSFIAHYNLGTIRLRFKDLPSAIEDFQAALQTRPGFLDGRLNLANAYRQAGDFKEAEAQYRGILESVPGQDEARVGLALVLRDRGETDEAVKLLKQVEEEGTTGAIAQLLLARTATEEGNVTDALRYGEKALKIDPASYRTRTLLGNLYIQLEKPDEAIRHYDVASRNENDQSYPDAVNGLAVAYYMKKDYTKAKDYLDRIIKRAREYGNPAAFYVNRGNVSYQRGDYSAAEADYTKAEDLDRSSAIASYNLGVLKETQGEWQPATRSYRVAVRRRPVFPKAHFNLGNVYVAMNDRDLAIDEYRKVTEDDPNFDKAYVNLAIQLIEKGDYEEAIQYLERAAERTGGSVVISNALAIIYLQRDQPAKAEQMCDRSLEREPANPTGRLLRALVRIYQSRYTDAHEILADLSPSQELSLSYRTALGIANVRLGRFQGGLQNLENVLQLARTAPRGKRFLGDALLNLAWGNLYVGGYGQSQRLLEEAAGYFENGESERIQTALQQLRSI